MLEKLNIVAIMCIKFVSIHFLNVKTISCSCLIQYFYKILLLLEMKIMIIFFNHAKNSQIKSKMYIKKTVD